ncbi:MAG TPA: glycosyl hydrolase family 65 protein, partial [Aggregatilineaceae bacterium]|nr:glycosyl hydrolase family 65 protein [Aggregatilineaceae bacterium]
ASKTVSLDSERLVSMARPHLAAIHWTLTSDADCEVSIRSSIDAAVTNRFAEGHFSSVSVQADALTSAVTVTTIEPGYSVVVAAAHEIDGVTGPIAYQGGASHQRANFACSFRLSAGQTVHLTKFVAVYDSRFSTGDLTALARTELEAAQAVGYDAIRAEHAARWAELWADSDVIIEGDEQAQVALRFCLFHLLANAPHSDQVSISARGLQGQDYWGSIFWDCDIYVLPFFLYTQPAYARRSLLYRYHTLDGARRKAQGLGYRGAYYAWQSQETGDETCALYVFDDPRTGQKIRSYFADEQIHISSDVVYALWQYVQATGDWPFVADYGLEIACEVARFFASRAVHDPAQDRYELRTVLGPDEYHERVDNNAYTNALAAHSFQTALASLDRLRAEDVESYERLAANTGLTDAEIAAWRHIAQRLYVPAPDPASGLIAQFDGYFALEDAPPAVVRARLAHPDLHSGGPLGPYQTTQAIKQADVVLLLYLLRDQYPVQVKQANWAYYEPRTAHDSSLSPMAYALVAADVGRIDWAYRYFLQTAMIDLLGTGPHWNLGVHTAALGGAWLAVVHGFCRSDLREDGLHLRGWPELPAGWQRVSFTVRWHGHRVRFTSDGHTTTLKAESGPVPVIYTGGRAALEPGRALTLKVVP